MLYEVLTGRKAFPGETVSDIIASILARDPDWTALPQDMPVAIRNLLRRRLQREPHRRLRDIGDARIEIEESLAELSPVPSRYPTHAGALPLVIAGLAGAFVGGPGYRRERRLGFRAPFPLSGFRDASHFLSEGALSPDLFPSNKPATVRSSSNSGQWMYAPSPKISK